MVRLEAFNTYNIPLTIARSSIQNSTNLLSHNLQSLHATINAAQPLLTAAHAYPLPSFPGRTQEHSLVMLMRKKLQPPVEDWIDQGARNGQQLPGPKLSNGTANGETKALNYEQMEELWNWAGPEGNRIAREIGDDAFADVFTLAEQEDGIENVVTGLRRKFWESDDEDEDEADESKPEAMDVDVPDTRPEVVKRMDRAGVDESKPMLPLEMILKFTNTGQLPPGASIPTA